MDRNFNYIQTTLHFRLSKSVFAIALLIFLFNSGCDSQPVQSGNQSLNQAKSFVAKQQYAASIPVYKIALIDYEKKQDTLGIQKSINGLMYAFIMEKMEDSARKYQLKLDHYPISESQFEFLEKTKNEILLSEESHDEQIKMYMQGIISLEIHFPDSFALKANFLKSIASKWIVCCKQIDSASFYLKAAETAHSTLKTPPPVDVKGINYLWSRIHFLKGDYMLQENRLKDNLKFTENAFPNGGLLVGECYVNLATYYRTNRGQYTKSIQLLEKAIPNFSQNKWSLGQVFALLGTNYRHLGDHEQALKYYHLYESSLLHLKDSLGSDLTLTLAQNVNNMGNVFFVSHRYDSAISLYDSSLAMKKRAAGGHDGDRSTALSYFNSALVRMQINRFKEADSLFNCGLDIVGRDPSFLSCMARLSQADLYLKWKKPEQARIVLDDAWDFLKSRKGLPAQKAEAWSLEGRFSLMIGQPEKGVQSFHKVLSILDADLDEKETGQNPKLESFILPTILLKNLLLKSDAQRNANNPESALKTSLCALDLIDKMRSSFKEEGSKIFLSESAIPAFEHALDLCFNLKKENPELKNLAFDLMERSKSMIMLENLSGIQAGKMAGIPVDILDQQLDLREEIEFLQMKLGNLRAAKSTSISEISFLSTRLLETENNLDSLETSINLAYPDYSRFQNRTKITVKSVRDSLLLQDQGIIEYFSGDSSLFVLILSRKQLELNKFPKNEGLEKDIQALRKTITQPPTRIGRKRYSRLAYSLYQNLFEPIEPIIDFDQLLIVPDGYLSLIPFEALIRDTMEQDDYRKMSYLIHDYTISYLSSAAVLSLHRLGKSSTTSPTAYFGFSPEFSGKHKELTNLRKTVIAIGSSTKGQTVLGKSATKTRFLELAKEAGILHLATHAFATDDNPMNAWFAFSSDPDSPSDSALFAYELYFQRLNSVSLTILSACNTAYGKVERGEGIMSLARGFSYAGCPSTVMSLWEVADGEASQFITIQFLENINSGLAKNDGLRKAKLEYLSTARDNKAGRPFLWAVQVLIGDSSPIQTN